MEAGQRAALSACDPLRSCGSGWRSPAREVETHGIAQLLLHAAHRIGDRKLEPIIARLRTQAEGADQQRHDERNSRLHVFLPRIEIEAGTKGCMHVKLRNRKSVVSGTSE